MIPSIPIRLLAAILLFPWPGRAASVEPPNLDLIKARDKIVADSQARIQSDILDRVLGPGKASVFVDVEMDLRARRKENIRAGAGVAEKYKEKGARGAGFATQFILPGVPKPKSITGEPNRGKPAAAQGQTAAQSKTEMEEVFTQQLEFKKFEVTVIHDRDALTPEKRGEVRGLIVDAMKMYQVKPEDVMFRPATFYSPELSWKDDILDPGVYIPLLYALLLLLFLFFLFGPLARFLKRYVEALAQKPAAEVNIESNITPPEDEGGGGGEDGLDEGKLDIMIGRKPPEPSPDDEEDEMAKLEPFSYINEESLKRLANLFLLRREEPWLIAVVLSYLRQDYARQVLAALPVELQTKVAMEALKVRQVTREQIQAIDDDIKENVNFVVGGIERLTRMLEESDAATRMNILESLKNEKPVVYEHVRRSILLFEDIPSFPDREMQVIVRELKTEAMARALQGAPPEVVNKFFNNMSSNASSLLKESMEYVKDMTPAQIEEERGKIMDLVKTMEKEGKISLRKDEEAAFQEVLVEDSARTSRLGTGAPAAESKPGPQADPAAAQQALQSGAQAQQSGDMEGAVRLFQEALRLDPNLWQAYQYLGAALYQLGRTSEALAAYEKVLEHNPDPQLRSWVDSFKAQMNQ